MSAAARVSLVVLIGVLLVLGLLRGGDDAQVSRTSFGAVPPGYRGVFEVLAELGLPVERELAAPARLAAGGTVWWLEPEGLCGGKSAAAESQTMADAGWPGRAWIEAGGTAVVVLPQGAVPCAGVAGVGLPPRVGLVTPAAPAKSTGRRRRLAEMWPRSDRPELAQVIDGPTHARVVRTEGLDTFVGADDWSVRARVEGRPFVLDRPMGAGRLVVIADPAPFQNAWLDKEDAAPWVVDLVRTWGAPRFDEHAHGVRAEDSAVRFLVRSPALGVFLGLGVLGGLIAWRGMMLPPRTTGRSAGAAPVLEPFVDALAALYARTRDYDHASRRYRDLGVARLCRHLGLPPGITASALRERLEAGGRLAPATLHRVLDPGPVRSERALQALARDVDDLLREVGA